MTDTKKSVNKKWTTNKITLFVVGILALFAIAFFAAKIYTETPRDLSPDLVYVGKQDYGNVFGFDQLPGSNYYFATSMSKEGFKNYLEQLAYNFDDSQGSGNGVNGKSSLSFKAKGTPYAHNIYIDYFDSLDIVYDSTGLIFKTIDNKPFIIKINDKVYPQLRAAIQAR